ncbi:phg1b [Symbiodinium sp. CCMP2456]|nr:phg1b [Symbiodinium sp. CCMP2456]
MASSKQLAAWLLIGLATAGLLLPALIILVLRPQEARRVHEAVHATAPLDIYLVLDASGSVDESDWRESLLFARDLSVQLNASVPQFRAGLGQFSSNFHDIFPVSEDVSLLAALPQGVQKKSGRTEMAKALCGNSFDSSTKQEEAKDRCVGGAYGTLMAAPAQLPVDLPPNCEELSSSRLIILVTDGRPGPEDKSKLASAFLKSNTNVTVLGILVKHDAKAVEGQILYALSSCCPAESMKVTGTKDVHVACELPMNESCHYMASMKDYAALRRSIDGIVRTLGDKLQCEGVQESVSFLPDERSLWFLVLLLPVLLHQIWQRSLLRISSSYKPKEAHGLPPTDVEMTTDVSRGSKEETQSPAAPTTGSEAADEARASQAAETVQAESRASAKGKKWAPVRTAYIINGARVDVDYGRSSNAPPPTAPNAARRGNSFASVNDFPETAMQTIQTGTDANSSVAGVISFVHAESLAPEVRRFNCHIFVPLLLTLLMLPFVIVKSGILSLMESPAGSSSSKVITLITS